MTEHGDAPQTTHIRYDSVQDLTRVVTFCGVYKGSSVSAQHMVEVDAGKIAPFGNAVHICQECLDKLKEMINGR